MHAPRWLTVGIVAVPVTGALVLGLAAPADALSPPAPPSPVSLSSELAAAAGGDAELGASLAGGSGVAALGAAAPLAVAFGGFRFGFQLTGTVLSAFGVDENSSVCQLVNQTGTSQLNGLTNLVTGASCQPYTNTLTAAQRNADVPPSSFAVGSTSAAPDGWSVTLSGTGITPSPGNLQYGPMPSTWMCFSTSFTVPTGGRVLYHSVAGDSGSVMIGVGAAQTRSGSGGWSSTPDTANGCATVAGAQWYGSEQFWPCTSTPYCNASTSPPVSWFAADASGNGPATAPAAPGNATRHWGCTIVGSDGKSYTGVSQDFTELDASLAQWACPTLPAGVLPTSTELDLVTPSLGTSVKEWSGTTTSAYQAAAAAYPECATGTCHLVLLTGTRVDCATAGSCAQWFTDPNKATDYICEYGTHDVALSECNVLSHFYDPQAVASGSAYSDPATGAAVSTATSGSVDLQANASPVINPDVSPEQCFTSGWASAANPIEWVFVPVKCALQNAFVPRESVVNADNTKIRNAVAASGIGSVLGILGGIASFPITGNGCSGIPWHFQVYSFSFDTSLLAACPGDPLATTAGYVKGILTVIVWTAAAFAWARYIASIFGYVGYGGPTAPGPTTVQQIDARSIHLYPRSGGGSLGGGDPPGQIGA